MDPILLGLILASAGEATKFALDLIKLIREGQNSGWTDEEVRARYDKMVADRNLAITEWQSAGGPPPGTKADTGID